MKQCQSCGLPLKKDPNGLWGGTNTDGTISDTYCSLCYTNGEFHYKGNDMKEFQNIVEQKMKEGGHSWFMRKLTRWGIPHLKRRKNKA